MKEDILKRIDPIIDGVIALLATNDEEKLMGRFMALTQKVSQGDVDSALELAFIVAAAEANEHE